MEKPSTAKIEVSLAAFQEIKDKMLAAGCGVRLNYTENLIDMDGICITPPPFAKLTKPEMTDNPTEFPSLTNEENSILRSLLVVWQKFVQLERLHPDELNEFRHKFHELQRMVITRAYYRDRDKASFGD